MDKICKVGLAVLSVFIFISFFLPWVGVESAVTGGISKVLKKEAKPITAISGFRVPIMANGPESKLMITILKLFNPGVKDADKKSYLIWLVPGLSLILLAVIWFLASNKWANLAVGILGVALFAGATFKILTTDLDKAVVKVNIMYGMWLTLVGYLIIGILCLANFALLLKPTNERR
jgi:hypothetical protein